jgi:hypothetical protein
VPKAKESTVHVANLSVQPAVPAIKLVLPRGSSLNFGIVIHAAAVSSTICTGFGVHASISTGTARIVIRICGWGGICCSVGQRASITST